MLATLVRVADGVAGSANSRHQIHRQSNSRPVKTIKVGIESMVANQIAAPNVGRGRGAMTPMTGFPLRDMTRLIQL